jgi:hypothetical protein
MDLKAQLNTDLDRMPIEDASIEWPEDISPYATLAKVAVSKQSAWNEASSAAVDDGMSFSPWHGLQDHRPLGSVMRGRRPAYRQSAQFRAEGSARAVVEPKSMEDFPD